MAAGQFYKGKNLRIRVEGSTVFHATTCNLTITKEIESLSTKDTNGKIVIPGDYEGSLSTDCLVADKETAAVDVVDWTDLMQFLLDGTKLTWDFSTGVVGDKIISGAMYINESNVTAENGTTSTGSFSFTTDGDITITTVMA